jgi:hypothetical protein
VIVFLIKWYISFVRYIKISAYVCVSLLEPVQLQVTYQRMEITRWSKVSIEIRNLDQPVRLLPLLCSLVPDHRTNVVRPHTDTCSLKLHFCVLILSSLLSISRHIYFRFFCKNINTFLFYAYAPHIQLRVLTMYAPSYEKSTKIFII